MGGFLQSLGSPRLRASTLLSQARREYGEYGSRTAEYVLIGCPADDVFPVQPANRKETSVFAGATAANRAIPLGTATANRATPALPEQQRPIRLLR